MSKLWMLPFTTEKGDKMVFPSYIVRESDFEEEYFLNDRLNELQSSSYIYEMMLGVTFDKELTVLEADDMLVMYNGTITHRAFAHGGASVYLIGGPEFDKLETEHKGP